MRRRRRAALLLGLALVLGGLAASDVSRREAALRAQLGPVVEIVVAAGPLDAGRRLSPGDLSVRGVPERYAPAGSPALPELLVGRRLAVAVPAGGFLTEHQLEDAQSAPGPAVRRGERAAEVIARASPELIGPGSRVDVLVTRDRGDGVPGTTELALEDVEVLGARAARPDGESAGPRVAATLRVTVRQAVYLAAAGAFAREIRLLARAPGDRRRAGPAVVADDLG